MRATSKASNRTKLPGSFPTLVLRMPPRAIMDDVDYENTLAMIDRLMAGGKLTGGQSLYLETLVQLVQVYEAAHRAIDTSDLTGLASLKHLMDEHGMNASDLGKLLGGHPSMGSKILKGDRALTIDHVKKLSARFKVGPETFIH